jgi:hypothetical protein
MKNAITVLAVIVLLTGCGQYPKDNTSLQAKVTGTWTITGVMLPDLAQVNNVTTSFEPDGGWTSHYTVTRAGNSKQQTTSGSWQIEGDILYEQQTNVDGVTDSASQRAGSKIIQIDSHEMVLSNWYSPRRVFTRKP